MDTVVQGPSLQSLRVLVVEDETEIRQLIALHLRREGLVVDEVAQGEQATHRLSSNEYDLAVVDWMLPGMSGIEITRWIRGQGRFRQVPILFVTAKSEPDDIAEGLNAGADDYLTKPFDTHVLIARVRALLRRKKWLEMPAIQQSPKSELIVGSLVMYPDAYEAFLSGEKMDLTKSEFRLLQTLMENQGKVLSRDRLIEQIQGEGVNVVGRTIDTHVFGLRKKLGAHADMIETIRGVGYRVGFTGS